MPPVKLCPFEFRSSCRLPLRYIGECGANPKSISPENSLWLFVDLLRDRLTLLLLDALFMIFRKRFYLRFSTSWIKTVLNVIDPPVLCIAELVSDGWQLQQNYHKKIKCEVTKRPYKL